jgi:hypothetical protein
MFHARKPGYEKNEIVKIIKAFCAEALVYIC